MCVSVKVLVVPTDLNISSKLGQGGCSLAVARLSRGHTKDELHLNLSRSCGRGRICIPVLSVLFVLKSYRDSKVKKFFHSPKYSKQRLLMKRKSALQLFF